MVTPRRATPPTLEDVHIVGRLGGVGLARLHVRVRPVRAAGGPWHEQPSVDVVDRREEGDAGHRRERRECRVAAAAAVVAITAATRGDTAGAHAVGGGGGRPSAHPAAPLVRAPLPPRRLGATLAAADDAAAAIGRPRGDPTRLSRFSSGARGDDARRRDGRATAPRRGGRARRGVGEADGCHRLGGGAATTNPANVAVAAVTTTATAAASAGAGERRPAAMAGTCLPSPEHFGQRLQPAGSGKRHRRRRRRRARGRPHGGHPHAAVAGPAAEKRSWPPPPALPHATQESTITCSFLPTTDAAAITDWPLPPR